MSQWFPPYPCPGSVFYQVNEINRFMKVLSEWQSWVGRQIGCVPYFVLLLLNCFFFFFLTPPRFAQHWDGVFCGAFQINKNTMVLASYIHQESSVNFLEQTVMQGTWNNKNDRYHINYIRSERWNVKTYDCVKLHRVLSFTLNSRNMPGYLISS